MNIIDTDNTKLEGTCEIAFKSIKFKTRFTIEYSPKRIILKIPRIENDTLFGYGQFEGKINDCNTAISCSKICVSHFSKDIIVFVLLEDLFLGKEVTPIIFNTKLVGAYLGTFNIQFKNYSISLKESAYSHEILQFCRDYGNVLEGSELIIKGVEGQNLDQNFIIELVKDICSILSLIKGNMVSYNRCQFISEKLDKQSIWRMRTVSTNHATQCINLHQIDGPFKILLDNFYRLSCEKKKCFNTAIGYLNYTSTGYLEDNILNVAQAWEVLAEELSTKKVEMDDDIKVLKSNIKATIKNWKKENGIHYTTEFISNRLINSLKWETATKKMENLAKQENLNFEKIGLNFKKLVDIRNSIAHTGRFKKVGEEDLTLELLTASILGLHVLLLSKLGYFGEIIERKGGFTIFNKISAFKNSPIE